ncbi:hypothetical protein BU17DRAFT_102591 [Hysterangium stoloniferum]|nr:hypothetical protein BU17DRAFT_102591 [Hysterangium stoloniferum]
MLKTATLRIYANRDTAGRLVLTQAVRIPCPRLAQTGENVSTEYIEDENGSPVDGTTAGAIRSYIRSIFRELLKKGTLPNVWSEVNDWKADYLISRVLSQWNTNKKRREKKSQSAKARPNDFDFEEAIRPVGEGGSGGSNFAMENLDDCHSEVTNMDDNTRNGSKKRKVASESSSEQSQPSKRLHATIFPSPPPSSPPSHSLPARRSCILTASTRKEILSTISTTEQLLPSPPAIHVDTGISDLIAQTLDDSPPLTSPRHPIITHDATWK